MLPPLSCGTYLVDDAMVEELTLARRGEHAANLGALLARRFAQAAGVNAYIVDPVTVDEWQPCARITGSPLVESTCMGHALNTKAVARRYARQQQQPYEALRLIIVHMGSGITVSAHQQGRMIDSSTIDQGPFGPDRSGSLPARALVKLCFSGKYSELQLDRQVFGDGGLFAYLGTRDLVEVERRIDAGDPQAAAIFEAMVLPDRQRSCLHGRRAQGQSRRPPAHRRHGLFGKSHQLSQRHTGVDRAHPGLSREDELQALAEGVFRVLDGEEQAKLLLPEITEGAEARANRTRLVIGLE